MEEEDLFKVWRRGWDLWILGYVHEAFRLSTMFVVLLMLTSCGNQAKRKDFANWVRDQDKDKKQ